MFKLLFHTDVSFCIRAPLPKRGYVNFPQSDANDSERFGTYWDDISRRIPRDDAHDAVRSYGTVKFCQNASPALPGPTSEKIQEVPRGKRYGWRS